MLAIRVSPNKSNLHFVCNLFEYQGLSKERKNYFDIINDSQICEINKQNSFSLVFFFFFFSVIKSVTHAISQSFTETVSHCQPVSQKFEKLVIQLLSLLVRHPLNKRSIITNLKRQPCKCSHMLSRTILFELFVPLRWYFP